MYGKLVIEHSADEICGYTLDYVENRGRKTLDGSASPLLAAIKTLVFIYTGIETDLSFVLLSAFVLSPCDTRVFVFF